MLRWRFHGDDFGGDGGGGGWSQKFVCAAHRWHCRHFVGKFFL